MSRKVGGSWTPDIHRGDKVREPCYKMWPVIAVAYVHSLIVKENNNFFF
jgi:hypothetical protein